MFRAQIVRLRARKERNRRIDRRVGRGIYEIVGGRYAAHRYVPDGRGQIAGRYDTAGASDRGVPRLGRGNDLQRDARGVVFRYVGKIGDARYYGGIENADPADAFAEQSFESRLEIRAAGDSVFRQSAFGRRILTFCLSDHDDARAVVFQRFHSRADGRQEVGGLQKLRRLRVGRLVVDVNPQFRSGVGLVVELLDIEVQGRFVRRVVLFVDPEVDGIL